MQMSWIPRADAKATKETPLPNLLRTPGPRPEFKKKQCAPSKEVLKRWNPPAARPQLQSKSPRLALPASAKLGGPLALRTTASPPLNVSGAHKPRLFHSRHVPGVVEDLVACPSAEHPSLARQLNGLLSHLKQQTNKDDERTKHAILTDCEALVPSSDLGFLRAEYARLCSFGDLTNTELLTSAKWIMFLQGCGAVQMPGEREGDNVLGAPVSLAVADILFHKVIYDCARNAKTLTFDLFCKALTAVASRMWPDRDSEAALATLLRQAADSAPDAEDKAVTTKLDPAAVLALYSQRSLLQKAFKTHRAAELQSPGAPPNGLGVVRRRERSCQREMHSSSKAGAPQGKRRRSSSVSIVSSTCIPDSRDEISAWQAEMQEIHRFSEVSIIAATNSLQLDIPEKHMALVQDTDIAREYQNGVPVSNGRRNRMSSGEFLAFYRSLEVPQDIMSPVQAIRIFKQVQDLDGPGSLYAHLSYKEFETAVGLMALQAYGQDPYAQQYPEQHERVQGFISSFFPKALLGLHHCLRC